MTADAQDPRDVYDVYLATCIAGRAEDPEVFLARHPGADTEARELIRALHREYAGGPPAGPDGLPFEHLGGYRLLRALGSGGMGTVFLAEQEALGRTVALKVVRPELGGSDTMLRRFEREALAIARLRHPGIVSVYELGEDQGVQFIAMEYVRGRSLAEILKLEETTPERIFPWMAQVGRALAYAHGQGVVHRDVKPGNVLITPDDEAVLLDFGIAHLTGQEATRLTKSFAGSPLYAAPEQISSGAVDARTDVYLLGVTTYEALTGCLPFHGGTLENVFRRVLLDDATPPSRVSAAVPRDADVVVLKAMEKKPDARYADMTSFVADLEALSRSQAVQARRPGPLARTAKWARRSPVRATIVAGLCLAVLGVAALLLHLDAERAARRRTDALRLVGRARVVLAEYREARIASKDAAQEWRELSRRVGRYSSESDEQRYEELLDQAEKVGLERDLMFSRVLELLRQARDLHREVPGVDEVTARLWLERAEEAHADRNRAAARHYRSEIARHDPDGKYTGDFLKSGMLELKTEPPGFDVYGFRRELQRDVLPEGDRRLVPVPLGRDTTPVPPGTWALRIVRGAGDVKPGDLILEVFGHPIEATFLAASDHGEVRRGDRLVAIGERRVRYMIDALPPATAGPHRYVFERDGGTIEVHWEDPPVALLSAAVFAERGGIPARLYQHGEVRDVVLPKGLVVRTTATPYFISSACLVGRTPTPYMPFEPGRYIFILRKEGYEDLILQRQVDGGDSQYRRLAPNPIGTTPPGFVFISLGHGEKDSFWVQEHEVTNAEYLEFLNDPQVLAEVDAAKKQGRYIRYPRDDQTNAATGGYWPRGMDGRFELPPDWPSDRPVMCLALEDVRAYVRWRGTRDGRPYALPTRAELTRSCAGWSECAYPFGDVFRKHWVSSLHLRPTTRGFDPVMSFPVDESPTGVYDLSGSAMEWVEWDGRYGYRGMAVGGSALRGEAWEFAVGSMHPRKPEYAGGDCGFRMVLRRRDVVASESK